MKRDATELLKAVRATSPSRKSSRTRLDKFTPAKKAINIPLPFDAVMSAIVKIKPEPKEPLKPAKKKRD
jgi:hypothetical protein